MLEVLYDKRVASTQWVHKLTTTPTNIGYAATANVLLPFTLAQRARQPNHPASELSANSLLLLACLCGFLRQPDFNPTFHDRGSIANGGVHAEFPSKYVLRWPGQSRKLGETRESGQSAEYRGFDENMRRGLWSVWGPVEWPWARYGTGVVFVTRLKLLDRNTNWIPTAKSTAKRRQHQSEGKWTGK